MIGPMPRLRPRYYGLSAVGPMGRRPVQAGEPDRFGIVKVEIPGGLAEPCRARGRLGFAARAAFALTAGERGPERSPRHGRRCFGPHQATFGGGKIRLSDGAGFPVHI